MIVVMKNKRSQIWIRSATTPVVKEVVRGIEGTLQAATEVRAELVPKIKIVGTIKEC